MWIGRTGDARTNPESHSVPELRPTLSESSPMSRGLMLAVGIRHTRRKSDWTDFVERRRIVSAATGGGPVDQALVF